MNYEEALGFIHSVNKFGIKLGLENVARLLGRLGNPQKSLKFIHVAGTNGKGTVTSTLAEILKSEGYKVGMYTSPFIYDFCERIKVNGEMIPRNALAEITETVRNECSAMVNDGFTHPTEFEVVTAIGFCWFEKCKCDYVVLEVGMGGRLDATNVIDPPDVSVITAIDYDHMEYLGNTLSDIAYEKCGIIKKDSFVAVYPYQDKCVFEKCESICAERGAKMFIAKKPGILKCALDGTYFEIDGKEYMTHLSGEHMINNIATAVCAIELLREKGVKISDAAVVDGIKNVTWPGRFEIISREPLFITDGAHNVSGVNALKNTIEKYLQGRKCVFLIGMLADKEYERSLAIIAPLADEIITFTVPSPRALNGDALAKTARKYNKSVKNANTPDEAVKEALRICGDKAIISFGSLYSINDIYNAFKNRGKDL